jgi:hypothetical protein
LIARFVFQLPAAFTLKKSFQSRATRPARISIFWYAVLCPMPHMPPHSRSHAYLQCSAHASHTRPRNFQTNKEGRVYYFDSSDIVASQSWLEFFSHQVLFSLQHFPTALSSRPRFVTPHEFARTAHHSEPSLNRHYPSRHLQLPSDSIRIPTHSPTRPVKSRSRVCRISCADADEKISRNSAKPSCKRYARCTYICIHAYSCPPYLNCIHIHSTPRC